MGRCSQLGNAHRAWSSELGAFTPRTMGVMGSLDSRSSKLRGESWSLMEPPRGQEAKGLKVSRP